MIITWKTGNLVDNTSGYDFSVYVGVSINTVRTNRFCFETRPMETNSHPMWIPRISTFTNCNSSRFHSRAKKCLITNLSYRWSCNFFKENIKSIERSFKFSFLNKCTWAIISYNQLEFQLMIKNKSINIREKLCIINWWVFKKNE